MIAMVAIINYEMGNLRSVANALDISGAEFSIVEHPEELKKFDHAILPGVGSFGICTQNLQKSGFDSAIKEFAKSGKPLMGICLGMQILASKGNEEGNFNGLDLIAGEVVHFNLSDTNLKVPHVGWNEVHFNDESHPLVKGIKQNTPFYFTHSYHYLPKSKANSFAQTEYGYSFTSSVIKNNIFATQFHPEKSQDKGLKLLQNFLNWNP